MWLDEVVTGSARTPKSRSFPVMILNPNQLFALYERGEIEREELHALMAVHARELISEMEEDYQNPAAALIENLLARRAVRRLARRHGGRLLREILIALADVPGCLFLHLFRPGRFVAEGGNLLIQAFDFPAKFVSPEQQFLDTNPCRGIPYLSFWKDFQRITFARLVR